ncbi:MAG: hypothetical protein L0287_25230 [Anaerolineae bacterium]|nr:hypothetical protein [Anaerolineae bacterium]
MKARTRFLIVVGLIILVLSIAWYTYPKRNQEPAQVFPATINRDCAPWDGAAFTLSIPTEDGIIIYVSIWQSPDIKLPVTFTFPDETGQIGFAYIIPDLDPLQQLSGEVFFWRVEEGIPVEGEFNFTTESGKQFKGKFKAEWGDQVVYCG